MSDNVEFDPLAGPDVFSPAPVAEMTEADVAPAPVEEEKPEVAIEKPEAIQEQSAPAPGDIASDPDKWAKRFETLSKQERAVRDQKKANDAYAAEVGHARKIAALAKSNPSQLIKELGVSMRDVVDSHLKEEKPDPLDKIAELERKIAYLEEKGEATQQSIATQSAATKWDMDFERVIDKEEYGIIRDSPGAVDRIVEGVSQHYKKTGQLLPPKMALDIMAKQLADNLKAMRKYLPQDESAAPTATVAPQAKAVTGPKTLQTKTTGSVPRFSRNIDDDEIEMERIGAKYSTKSGV